MAQSEDVVVALARAYSLTELFPVEDPRVQNDLEEATARLEGDLVLHVDGGALRAGDERLAEENGWVGELARDLELAGVAELHLPADVEVENLVALVRSLREGAGAGDGIRTAREWTDELPRIGVTFGKGGPDRAGPGRSVEAVFAGGDEPPGLEEVVDRYLDSPPDERSEQEDELLRIAEAVRSDGRIDELVDAVERLALDATIGSGDSATLRLARELLGPAEATRLALRLGSIRDEERRDALVEAAGKLGGEMATALAEALADTGDRAARRTCIEAMVALGDEARPEVERMLDDSRWFVVRNGVRILGGIGAEDAVEHLTSPLAHDDPRVRRETVMALGRIGGEDAGMLVLGMLDDPNADVRAAAATALGALGVQRAVKVLLERLEKEDSEKVQVQILRALGALGDPGAVPAIEKRAVATFFTRPPRPIRIAAYRALASIGTPHARELLEDARDDGDDEVRSAVRSLLADREG